MTSSTTTAGPSRVTLVAMHYWWALQSITPGRPGNHAGGPGTLALWQSRTSGPPIKKLCVSKTTSALHNVAVMASALRDKMMKEKELF